MNQKICHIHQEIMKDHTTRNCPLLICRICFSYRHASNTCTETKCLCTQCKENWKKIFHNLTNFKIKAITNIHAKPCEKRVSERIIAQVVGGEWIHYDENRHSDDEISSNTKPKKPRNTKSWISKFERDDATDPSSDSETSIEVLTKKLNKLKKQRKQRKRLQCLISKS